MTKIMTVEETRKSDEKIIVEQLVSHALIAAKMADKEIDVVQWALTWTDEMSDMKQKAVILSVIAKVLINAGEPQRAQSVFRAALNSASLAGREAVLETLAAGASTIAAKDQGRTLWEIYEALLEVEDWWKI